MKCTKISNHQWRHVRTRDGRTLERCQLCGTTFPCQRSGCGHVDCHAERKEPMPEGITLLE